MSTVWENPEIKEKILLLSPTLQETFLRAVDALHCKESSFMLTFIKESRDELRDTHKEIEREQEVLRDTSDLLASKRIYGDPDEWEDNLHEMNAVDEYLKRRNNGELSGLGILSFEDEGKSHKKAKKKDKDKAKKDKRSKSSRSDRTFDNEPAIESAGGELFGMEDETAAKSSKSDKKEKKKKDKKEKLDINDEDQDVPIKEKREKKQKAEKREATLDVADEAEAPKKEKKNKAEKRETTMELEADEEAAPKKEKKKKKDKNREAPEEEPQKRERTMVDVDDESQVESKAEEKDRKHEKEKEKEKKKDRRKLEEKSRRKSEEVLGGVPAGGDLLREKSAPVLISREQTAVEKETKVLMQEFLERQTTDVDQKAQFEEAMMKKLAKKRNPHAAEADQLLKQQAWADEAKEKTKADFEAKMMEKLRSRREKSGLSNREMSSLDEPGSADPDKQKKEKKKKKGKDKDRDEENDSGEEKEKKKKKKKDKDRDRESD